MSYEEIDRSSYGKDVFTNGAEGRYAKPKPISINGTLSHSIETNETKKRVPKVVLPTTDNPTEELYENGHSDAIVKTKKKSRKVHENGEIQNENTISQIDSTIVKPKKKRAPKIDLNNENIDPMPTTTTTEEPIKKKKSKVPKPISIEEEFQLINTSPMNELEEPSIEKKVKKTKKHKTPKTSTGPIASFDDAQMNNLNKHATNSEFNDSYKYDGTYGSIPGDISNDVPPYPGEDEQYFDVPQISDYETAITEVYSNLASAVNFSQYFGDDNWSITCLPKSARNEPKSRIRKMLPGGKDDKFDETSSTGTTNQKRGLFDRIRTSVSTLVRDENNMLFGESSNYDMLLYEDEEDDVDADDLHRYAQQLRDLEDNDREINPEYLVLRDGKTVYAVHETDADGKTTLSTRKPIYDRFFDQPPDDDEQIRKMKIFSRIKHTFSRNKQKDKDNLNITSPKSTYDTVNGDRKRNAKKSSNKYISDGMTTAANSELLMN